MQVASFLGDAGTMTAAATCIAAVLRTALSSPSKSGTRGKLQASDCCRLDFECEAFLSHSLLFSRYTACSGLWWGPGEQLQFGADNCVSYN